MSLLLVGCSQNTPAGKYRIGKEIMDFRSTGDYDTNTYYANFEV